MSEFVEELGKFMRGLEQLPSIHSLIGASDPKKLQEFLLNGNADTQFQTFRELINRLKNYVDQHPDLKQSKQLQAFHEALSFLWFVEMASGSSIQMFGYWLTALGNLKKEAINLCGGALTNSLSPQLASDQFKFIEVAGKDGMGLTAQSLQEVYQKAFSVASVAPEAQKHHAFAERLINPLPEDLDWQVAVRRYLSADEKTYLQAHYLKLMRDPFFRDTFFEAAVSVIELAVKAILLRIESDLKNHRSNSLTSQADLLSAYNHFALLVANYSPRHLEAFDSSFTRLSGQIFSEGHFIYSRPSEGAKLLRDPSLRQQFIKYLFIQQILLTTGWAFHNRPHLDIAVNYLSQHRTWLGRILNRVFGKETATMGIYRLYQQTLDVRLTAERKQELTELLGKKLRLRTDRLRNLFPTEEALLLESKFTPVVHSKGFSCADLLGITSKGKAVNPSVLSVIS